MMVYTKPARRRDRWWGQLAALSLTLALGWSFAQESTPAPPGALAGLRDSPALQAARAQLEAARTAAQGASFGWGISGQAGYSRAQLPASPLSPAPATVDASTATLGLSLSPVPFGDNADALERAQIAFEQAQLAYRQALTGVQAEALDSAYRLLLAREALRAARAGEEITLQSLAAVRARAEAGAASVADVRSAEANGRTATEQVRSAQENLAVAEALAAQYWPGAVPALALPPAPPAAAGAAVERARLELRESQLLLRGAQRNLQPTVQASYAQSFDQAQWGVSLDSRTLAPKLSVGFNSQPDLTRARSTITLGANFDLSSATLANVGAARAQLAAAQARLAGAQRDAELQRLTLDTQLGQARRNVALKERALADARQSLAEARERETLGLISPLDTLQASVKVTTAGNELDAARSELLGRLLDLYRLYNTPLHEVNQ